MDTTLQIADRLLTAAALPKNRLVNKIKLIDKILEGETDKENKILLKKERKELVFQFYSGIKTDEQYHSQLIEIYNALPTRDWYKIKEAFKVWKKEDGRICTELSPLKKFFGRSLLVIGYALLMAGTLMCTLVIHFKVEFIVMGYAFISFLLLISGFVLMFRAYSFYEAVNIQKHLSKKKD